MNTFGVQRIHSDSDLNRIYGSVSKPCTPGEHQNSWDLWMFIPLKMVSIGIDPYPYIRMRHAGLVEIQLHLLPA